MPVDVLTEIDIERPREDVAAFACNPYNAPRWYENIQSVEWQTTPPLRVGSRVAFVARFLGRTLAYTYEIIELVPGRRLLMRTTEGPFPMETTYEFEARGDHRTRMSLRNRGSAEGFSRIIAPFLAIAMRYVNRKDLARLRALLTAGASVHP